MTSKKETKNQQIRTRKDTKDKKDTKHEEECFSLTLRSIFPLAPFDLIRPDHAKNILTKLWVSNVEKRAKILGELGNIQIAQEFLNHVREDEKMNVISSMLVGAIKQNHSSLALDLSQNKDARLFTQEIARIITPDTFPLYEQVYENIILKHVREEFKASDLQRARRNFFRSALDQGNLLFVRWVVEKTDWPDYIDVWESIRQALTNRHFDIAEYFMDELPDPIIFPEHFVLSFATSDSLDILDWLFNHGAPFTSQDWLSITDSEVLNYLNRQFPNLSKKHYGSYEKIIKNKIK